MMSETPHSSSLWEGSLVIALRTPQELLEEGY